MAYNYELNNFIDSTSDDKVRIRDKNGGNIYNITSFDAIFYYAQGRTVIIKIETLKSISLDFKDANTAAQAVALLDIEIRRIKDRIEEEVEEEVTRTGFERITYLSGNTWKLIDESPTMVDNNTVYLPNLNIGETPLTGITSDMILVRDSGGTVKEVSQIPFLDSLWEEDTTIYPDEKAIKPLTNKNLNIDSGNIKDTYEVDGLPYVTSQTEVNSEEDLTVYTLSDYGVYKSGDVTSIFGPGKFFTTVTGGTFNSSFDGLPATWCIRICDFLAEGYNWTYLSWDVDKFREMYRVSDPTIKYNISVKEWYNGEYNCYNVDGEYYDFVEGEKVFLVGERGIYPHIITDGSYNKLEFTYDYDNIQVSGSSNVYDGTTTSATIFIIDDSYGNVASEFNTGDHLIFNGNISVVSTNTGSYTPGVGTTIFWTHLRLKNIQRETYTQDNREDLIRTNTLTSIIKGDYNEPQYEGNMAVFNDESEGIFYLDRTYGDITSDFPIGTKIRLLEYSKFSVVKKSNIRVVCTDPTYSIDRVTLNTMHDYYTSITNESGQTFTTGFTAVNHGSDRFYFDVGVDITPQFPVGSYLELSGYCFGNETVLITGVYYQSWGDNHSEIYWTKFYDYDRIDSNDPRGTTYDCEYYSNYKYLIDGNVSNMFREDEPVVLHNSVTGESVDMILYQIIYNPPYATGKTYIYFDFLNEFTALEKVDEFNENALRVRDNLISDTVRTGKLRITDTPITGSTSDKILVRDTTGNVKSIEQGSVSLPDGTINGETIKWNGISWVANSGITDDDYTVLLYKDHLGLQYSSVKVENYRVIIQSEIIGGQSSSMDIQTNNIFLGSGGGQLMISDSGNILKSFNSGYTDYTSLSVYNSGITSDNYPISKITEPQSITTKEYVTQETGGGIPSGTNGQTIVNSGGTWTINDRITDDGIIQRIGVGDEDVGSGVVVDSGVVKQVTLFSNNITGDGNAISLSDNGMNFQVVVGSDNIDLVWTGSVLRLVDYPISKITDDQSITTKEYVDQFTGTTTTILKQYNLSGDTKILNSDILPAGYKLANVFVHEKTGNTAVLSMGTYSSGTDIFLDVNITPTGSTSIVINNLVSFTEDNALYIHDDSVGSDWNSSLIDIYLEITKIT